MAPIENHGARANCKSNYLCRVAHFTIEITNMHRHAYDFGPKAMLSNAGL